MIQTEKQKGFDFCRVGVVTALIVAIPLGVYLFEITTCGNSQRELAWLDIGTPNVENGYKQMFNDCHNVFGQDYTHNFDDLLKFYPNLQEWRKHFD